MDWPSIEENEKVLWRGRPAPRCFTFRYWKQALAGSMLFLLSSFWLMIAVQLVEEGQPSWLLMLPPPLILASFIFGPFQILLARWRWPHIFYLLTERRLILQGGRQVLLSEIVAVKIKRQGKALASIRLERAAGKPLILHCIEQPDILLELLKERNLNS